MNVSLNLFKVISVEKLANRLGTHIVEIVSVSFCILFESHEPRMDCNISLLHLPFGTPRQFPPEGYTNLPTQSFSKRWGHVIVPTRPWVASNVQVTYSAPVSSKFSTAWQLTEELLAEEVRRKYLGVFGEKNEKVMLGRFFFTYHNCSEVNLYPWFVFPITGEVLTRKTHKTTNRCWF